MLTFFKNKLTKIPDIGYIKDTFLDKEVDLLMKKLNLRYLTLSGILLAVLIVCAQLTIPLPIVPLTLQTLAVGLVASLLPVNYALEVIVAYLLLGILGVPVFASFSSGFGIIVGPTGGYLLTFLLYVLITASILRFKQRTFLTLFCANILGALAQLFFGALWMIPVLKISLTATLLTGVVPFILPAIIKVILVCLIVQKLPKTI